MQQSQLPSSLLSLLCLLFLLWHCQQVLSEMRLTCPQLQAVEGLVRQLLAGCSQQVLESLAHHQHYGVP